ncbi:MAG: PAS domain S-box protein [Thermodesulfovibrionales bacterium]
MARTHSPSELRRLASFPLMNPNPVLEVDLKGKVCFINPAAQTLFPRIRSAGLRHPFLADFALMLSAVRAEKKGICTREVRVGQAWYVQTVHLVSAEGVLRIYGHDITPRKETEEALRQSEERFRLIAETSNDIIFQIDLQGRVTYCSPAMTQYGYAPRDVIQSHFSGFFSGTELPKAELVFEAAIAGERVDYVELDVMKADGSVVNSEISIAPLRKAGGIVGLQGIARDITGRKQVEEYLRRAKEDLEVRVLERTRDLMAANEKLAAEIAEREEREHQTRTTNDLLKLFSHTFLRRDYLDELVRLLGKWCPCTSVGIRQLDEEGAITYAAHEGFSPEFMEQKDCLPLKKNRCTCPRVLEGKPDASELPFMTPGGSFYCNDISCLPSKKAKGVKRQSRRMCALHKYASFAVIPIRYRERALGAIHLADTRKGLVPLSLVAFIESMTPLIGEALYRFSVEEAFMTSRQQLRELSGHLLAAREEERTKVAREIHDELGQLLTAAMIELSSIRGKYKKQKPLVEKILSVSGLLDGAVQDIQRICSGLRPRLLDHLGLRAAIEWEAGQFLKRSGIKCSLKMPQNQKKFSPAVATSLFRIFQEALTNVSRHAGATEVFVLLAVGDGSVVLEIKDNGRGISREKLAGNKSFGIMGIHERAYDLGGTVTIKGTRKGTTVSVEVPLLPDTEEKHA